MIKDVTPQTPVVKRTLIWELEQTPQSWYRDDLIDRLLKGKYHEFHATSERPRVALIKRLLAMDLKDLAVRVTNGEFADEPCARKTCHKCDVLYENFEKSSIEN